MQTNARIKRNAFSITPCALTASRAGGQRWSTKPSSCISRWINLTMAEHMVMGSRAGITSVCCKGLQRLTAMDDSARIVFTPHGQPR